MEIFTLCPLDKVRTSRLFDLDYGSRQCETLSPASYGGSRNSDACADGGNDGRLPAPTSVTTSTACGIGQAACINAHYCASNVAIEEDPLAIRLMTFCADSRRLIVAGSLHLCIFQFARRETNIEIPVCNRFCKVIASPASSLANLSFESLCIGSLLVANI
ncbi:unnamed protein product [Protopolystoma xenopodis]|uniref:Uncharacterized protein n=1 Tax=Protopolystoma xenopodis TaxID=117903 RepID=A0A3S5BE92_9PLAT|nr:unnamed protein product [Protopolystoma xenopodis]